MVDLGCGVGCGLDGELFLLVIVYDYNCVYFVVDKE